MNKTVPNGWTISADTTAADPVNGVVEARKWFDGHYKTASVGVNGNLYAACAAVDQEIALRTQGAVDAANTFADNLEAKAGTLKTFGGPHVAEVKSSPQWRAVNRSTGETLFS